MLALAAPASAIGCAGGLGRTAPPSPSPLEVATRETDLLNGFVTATLKIPAEPAGPRPVVLSPISGDETLLRRGYAVARFETNWDVLRGLRRKTAGGANRAGGDAADGADGDPAREDREDREDGASGQARRKTVGTWLLAAPRPGVVGRTYFGFIATDANTSVPAVVDWLEGLPEIDPRRIAIAGSSTGGFTALEALIAEPRLAAGVVRVACGDYHEFLRSSSLALAGEARWLVEGEIALDEDYSEALRRREPIRFAERLPPRPLLLLNGARDPAIPLGCALPTAGAFARAYARSGVSDRFRFVLYEDRGHDLGAGARDEVLAWWERWLGDAVPAPPAEGSIQPQG